MDETFNNQKNKKLLILFFVSSLVLHLIISLWHITQDINFKFTADDQPEKKIIIKLQSLKQKKAKQIVETEKSIENDKLDKARFLSKEDNIFLKETKSANIGSFQTAAKGDPNAKAKKDQRVQKKVVNEKFKDLKIADLGIKADQKAIVRPKKKIQKKAMVRKGLKSGKVKGRNLGSSNDFLEDIPLGDFTKLNTQEYEFYGFYHRIKEKLEQFWGANIQEQAEKIFKQGRSIASDSNLVTGLVISLNAKGEIVHISLKSTSGIKELDEAAVESFNQAGPFPNPPKGMIRGGVATIEWGFVVNT